MTVPLTATVQEDAAHAYDLAALACKGMDAQINFSPVDYREQLAEIEGYSRVGQAARAGERTPALQERDGSSQDIVLVTAQMKCFPSCRRRPCSACCVPHGM